MGLAEGRDYMTVKTITTSDAAGSNNTELCQYIQVTTAGNLVFRNRDGSLTPAIPLLANSTFGVGSDMINLMATNTTATGILGYF